MEKQVFVHIGYPKTASTWLQRLVFPKIKGLSYLDQFTDNIVGETTQNRKEIIASVLNDQSLEDTLLISSENISMPSVWNDDLDISLVKARNIHALLPDAKIIVLLRSQEDFILSLYTHLVKRGGVWRSKDSFLKKHEAYILKHFCFHELIGEYQKLFGKDNVQILLYEEFRQDPMSVYNKMIEFMGLTSDLDSALFKKSVNATSRSQSYITAMNVANFIMACLFFPFDKSGLFENIYLVKQRIAEIYEPFFKKHLNFGEQVNMSAQQKQYFDEIFAKSNKITEELAGEPLGKWGYVV